ncbi:hypothetical protein HPB51_025286 [Rhipicephalus microplus]|uniref:Tick transposon n=1 Tax=Rhipicephalus microplus TaxID=6941 RepID=A0A9J6E5H9_RHIMP|nr:hypothetical protein HPB51_025286 [Rhipicephalus microplus]
MLDYLETRQRTHSPRRLTTPTHPFRRSSARAMLRIFVLRAMCALHTRTHVWLQDSPHDRCRVPASTGVPGPSCFGFAPTVPAPLQGSFRFTSSWSPSCAECPAEETTEHILLHCPGYREQRRRLFDAYGHLGLPHVSLDHLRFPQAPCSSLMRAFEALLAFFGDAALIARL